MQQPPSEARRLVVSSVADLGRVACELARQLGAEVVLHDGTSLEQLLQTERSHLDGIPLVSLEAPAMPRFSGCEDLPEEPRGIMSGLRFWRKRPSEPAPTAEKATASAEMVPVVSSVARPPRGAACADSAPSLDEGGELSLIDCISRLALVSRSPSPTPHHVHLTFNPASLQGPLIQSPSHSFGKVCSYLLLNTYYILDLAPARLFSITYNLPLTTQYLLLTTAQ